MPWKYHQSVRETIRIFVWTSFTEVYPAAKPGRVLHLGEAGTLPVDTLSCKMSAHQKTVRMHWCWWDFHQERFPQQRPGDSHSGIRNLAGNLFRNVRQSKLRVCVVTQSKRHLPKPTQAALPSGSLLFLNRLFKSFFLQKLLWGLEFVLMQNRKKISEI